MVDDVLLLMAKGVAIGIAVAAPVGAVGILVIRRALAERPWIGFIGGLGGALGDAIFAAFAGFGLTAVTTFLTTWQQPLRIGGGLIIIGIGVGLLLHMRHAHNVPQSGGHEHFGKRRSFFAGLLLTLGNPIPALSFFAIFAATGLNDAPSFAKTGVLVASVFAGSALWFLALSQSAYAISQRYGERAARFFDALAAALLIALGIIAVLAPV